MASPSPPPNSLLNSLLRWPRHRPLVFLCLLLILVEGAALFFVPQFFSPQFYLPRELEGSKHFTCEGIVVHDPLRTLTGWRFDTALSACGEGITGKLFPARGTVRLTAFGNIETLEAGDVIRFFGSLHLPHDFQNPGSFSYARALAAKGIGAVGSIADGSMVARIGVIDESSWRAPLAQMRRTIKRSIEATITGPSAYLLKAVAIGWRDGVEAELRDDFARTGLAHLLAISGLHVGFIAAIAMWCAAIFFRRFPRLFNRFPLWSLTAVVAIPAVWSYVILAGMPVSAVRAAIMATVFLGGQLLWRRQDAVTSLAAACFLIVVVWPLAVTDVSFQLSAAAVAGIIATTPRIFAVGENFFHWDLSRWTGRLVRGAMGIAAVSAAATLATAPLVAYHFHVVTSVGLIANLIAVPLAGIPLMSLIAAGMVLALIAPPLAPWAWQGAALIADLITRLAHSGAQLGVPFTFHTAPNLFEVVLAYLVIATLFFSARLPQRRLVITFIFGIALVDWGVWHIAPRFNRTLQVVFLDVGQGDAALVRFPGGSSWLVDGGGMLDSDFDIGQHVVAPALWSLGIQRLDGMVLSHPHADHYRGLGFIAAAFHPTFLWTNGVAAPVHEVAEWQAFKTALAAAHVQWREVSNAMPPLVRAGVDIRVLHPSINDRTALDVNDSSLILSLRYGSTGFLFAGDMGRRGEEELVRSGTLLPASVLKVGHHGSATSSTATFLDAVQPAWAIVSVGERNRYGLPDDEVLARLAAHGAHVLRTDRDGAIVMVSDGTQIDVRAQTRRDF